jgi:DNA-binding MarR family transcriptional regulator
MADTAPAETELSEASQARLKEIRQLTEKGKELYAALEANSQRRNALIVEEMDAKTVARVISEASGLTVARIYKLRDNGRK